LLEALLKLFGEERLGGVIGLQPASMQEEFVDLVRQNEFPKFNAVLPQSLDEANRTDAVRVNTFETPGSTIY